MPMISAAVSIRKRFFYAATWMETNKSAGIMPSFAETAALNLDTLRKSTPVVHAITNFVTMGWVADVLAAVGASPLMADAPDEVEAAVTLADALILNLGTLNPARLNVIRTAGFQAAALGRPVVLDPVGAGALSPRTEAARALLDAFPVRVLRANASEMMALTDHTVRSRGMDTAHPVDAAQAMAGELAAGLGLTTVVTGAEDLLTTGRRWGRIANGHVRMARVPGTGCAAGALIGAFLAVDPDPFAAALSALVCLNLAGETAARKTTGAGSFKVALIDALDTLTPAQVRRDARINTGDSP